MQAKLRQTSKQRREFINITLGRKEEVLIGLKQQSANKKLKNDFKYWAGCARTHTETTIDEDRNSIARKIGSPAECGNLLSLIEHISKKDISD